MKPRIRSHVWTAVGTGASERRWHVEFDDTCGCREEVDFATRDTAQRFVNHLAGGGDRWGFVE